jgi:hypothetical protein
MLMSARYQNEIPFHHVLRVLNQEHIGIQCLGITCRRRNSSSQSEGFGAHPTRNYDAVQVVSVQCGDNSLFFSATDQICAR